MRRAASAAAAAALWVAGHVGSARGGGSAVRCSVGGEPVEPVRCAGLSHCVAWNGRDGPSDCRAVEAQAVAAVDELFDGVAVTEVHTACKDALTALHCARAFSAMECDGDAAGLALTAPPCGAACERILADCARHTALGPLQPAGAAELCSAEDGYGADEASCAELPRQDQLVLAAQHGLSPLAVDYIAQWEADEQTYDDTFLSSTHHTARSELKGWSFYTKGARWFDPAWFGQEQEGSPAQRQYSQLQAAEYVLRARIKRRAEEEGGEGEEGGGGGDEALLRQLGADEPSGGGPGEAPLFGWMEAATCLCVLLAYRFQRQLAAEEAEALAAEQLLADSAADGPAAESAGADDGPSPR